MGERSDKLAILDFLAHKGLQEAVQFDTSLYTIFSSASDRVVEIRSKLKEAQRCAECDCANGGDECNWIAAREQG